MMGLEKTTRMNYLFDFYQELLTPKQRSYMSLYYLDDHSLGEIAEEYKITRQAVYDNIRRTEAMLEEYEEKLELFEKFQRRQQLVSTFEKQPFTDENVQKFLDELKEWD
jgi:predicted DNA-binding protein YlxM (UPF0122 family)